MRAALAAIMLRTYGVYAVMVFAFVTFAVLIAVTVTPGLERRRKAAHVGARWIFRLCRVPIELVWNAPLPGEPCVVVANHASYLDGVILCAALPPRFTFVIKREITRVPFAHFLLRRIGAHFVERHDRHRGASDTRTLLRAAREGNSLAVFPEGTFHARPGLRRFRSGAFAAAVAGALPVVPLTIVGSRAILPARRWLPRPGALTLTVHPPIACCGEGRPEMMRLAAASRAVLLTTVGEPDLEAPHNRATAPPRERAG